MATLRQRSSTDGLLRGMSYRGQRIAGVFKGKGTERVIRFENGKSEKVHRKDLHELAKLRGTEIYRGRYKAADRAGKRRMFARSMTRQRALHRNFLKRMQVEADAAPKRERGRIQKRIAQIASGKFGSPLTGRRPASALWSNGRPFAVARKVGKK